jgi:beta-barrel assembly-enhancing protease
MLNLRSRKRPWFYPAVSTALALAICLGQPMAAQALNWGDLIRQGIQVIQLSNISDQQEMDLGKQINDNVAKQYRFSRDRNLVNYINDIGSRLASQSSRPNITYTFQVVDDDNINAFATMGGYVYVHTGLIKAADNEAQLASVMAHEIGHIAGRHSIKQTKSDAIAQGLIGASGLKNTTIVALASDLALRRPHSRRDEFDADQNGLKTLTNSSYAQPQMVKFMEKLLAFKSSLPTFLSTHPATADRIKQLEASIKKSPSNGTDGTDNLAYARRVGKPVTGSSDASNNPAPSTPIPPNQPRTIPGTNVPLPTSTPVPGRGGDVVVPTE